MADDTTLPALRYFLPETLFKVKLTKQIEIVARPAGHFLRHASDVVVVPTVAADKTGRCKVDISAGLLEEVNLTVSLDDAGMIESINGSAARNVSAIISLVGKIVGAALAVVSVIGFSGGSTWEDAPSLEDQWATKNPDLKGLLEQLATKQQTLTAALATDISPTDIVDIGAALQAVQREVAALDQIRREWMVDQASTDDSFEWTLRSSDIFRVTGTSLPASLPRDQVQIPPAAQALADEGILIALAEEIAGFNVQDLPSEPFNRDDSILLRRARPVSMGVYDLSILNEWVLKDELSVSFDIVDQHSLFDKIDLDGRWWSSQSVALDFHPDKSLKKFSVGSKSTIQAISDAAGTAVSSIGDGVSGLLKRPSAEERELEKSKLRLDLLKSSDDYAQLSATHNRSVELAEIEQRVKFVEAERKLAKTAIAD